MSRSRLPLVLLCVVAAALTLALVRSGDRPVRAASPTASTVVGTDGVAAEVLHGWDRRRAAAYAAGSPDDLRSLYVAGSAAGRSDVRLLRGYRARGFRVVGLRMQTLSLRVLAERPALLALEVTDRLAGAVAVSGGVRVRLPRDRPDTRRVTLVRGPGARWRVERVAPVRSGRRPAAR
jgi:hypothetical protein